MIFHDCFIANSLLTDCHLMNFKTRPIFGKNTDDSMVSFFSLTHDVDSSNTTATSKFILLANYSGVTEISQQHLLKLHMQLFTITCAYRYQNRCQLNMKTFIKSIHTVKQTNIRILYSWDIWIQYPPRPL